MHYLPRILLAAHHAHAWEKEDLDFKAVQRVGMFGLKPEAIAATAETLLLRAKPIDPIGQFYELVRQAHPSTWAGLCGDALLAIDYRSPPRSCCAHWRISAAGTGTRRSTSRCTAAGRGYRPRGSGRVLLREERVDQQPDRIPRGVVVPGGLVRSPSMLAPAKSPKPTLLAASTNTSPFSRFTDTSRRKIKTRCWPQSVQQDGRVRILRRTSQSAGR